MARVPLHRCREYRHRTRAGNDTVGAALDRRARRGGVRMSTRLIAEIGLNANGVPWLLLDVIKAFAYAGATDCKLQVRDIAAVYSPEFLASPRKSPWGM